MLERNLKMRKSFILSLILFFFFQLFCFYYSFAEKKSYFVGYKILNIPTDDNKKIAVAIWYPTDIRPKQHFYISGLIEGEVAFNAPFKKGKWPLVIYSHGFSGSGIASIEICKSLSEKGFVVVAPDHSDPVNTIRINGDGNATIGEVFDYLKKHPFNGPENSYRPKEVKLVLDYLFQSKSFFLDRQKIAMIGHSMGGWSVFTVALEDKRVKALVLYSMGELLWIFKKYRYFEADKIKRMKIPVIYFYGEREGKATSRGSYASFCFKHSNTPTYLVEVKGGSHFVYNSIAIARKKGGTGEQLDVITEITLSFLERYLLKRKVKIKADKVK